MGPTPGGEVPGGRLLEALGPVAKWDCGAWSSREALGKERRRAAGPASAGAVVGGWKTLV